MKNLTIATREHRNILLNDPYRPTYHFAIPDDNGHPGDPNGAFFVDGIYHLMYLYKNSKTNGYHWGHISSVDLLHWRHHPDALTKPENDDGSFSGGAFVDEDKTAYLSFWKFPSEKDDGGIGIAFSNPPYDKWERFDFPVIKGCKKAWGTAELIVDGKTKYIGCSDPSNIWKMNGYYYMQTGNLQVLDLCGRNDNSPEYYKGDWTELFRSKNLKDWDFVHRFYTNTHENIEWPDKTEDDMCPSFLPLYDAKENGNKTDKWLQLFISHNKGCQYYVGTLNHEKFMPEIHGRMSWNDSAYFAPEALIDNRNRHIVWAWFRDNIINDFKEYGWTGVYSFPRVVWFENNQLHMSPAEELNLLQYNRQVPDISDENKITLNNGEIFRLKAKINIDNQNKSGFSVRVDEEANNHCDIYYDAEKQTLVFDATESGGFGWKIKEEAPLCLENKEDLMLDIFVDKSVVEVYANEKQAISRRIYPQNPSAAVGIKLIGMRENVIFLEAWDMAPTNPY